MNKKIFREGFRDGIPIGLGYFAVSFSLGILARKAGINAIQGFVASFLTLASAGEYVAFVAIAESASYLELFIITIITNARYLLMSTALSQKFDEKTGLASRLGVGFGLTDEVFGITIARPGKVQPLYNYAAVLACAPMWALGTSLGIIAGEILPARFVSALSVSLYGMFVAIIIPPARKNRFIGALIALSFVLSYAMNRINVFSGISSGTKTIILTILIAGGAALIRPVNEEDSDENCAKTNEGSKDSDGGKGDDHAA